LGKRLSLIKMNFSLAMACFGEFWAVFFVRALPSHCNACNLVLEILKYDKV